MTQSLRCDHSRRPGGGCQSSKHTWLFLLLESEAGGGQLWDPGQRSHRQGQREWAEPQHGSQSLSLQVARVTSAQISLVKESEVVLSAVRGGRRESSPQGERGRILSGKTVLLSFLYQSPVAGAHFEWIHNLDVSRETAVNRHFVTKTQSGRPSQLHQGQPAT